MNKTYLIGGGIVVVAIAVFVIVNQSAGSAKQPTTQVQTARANPVAQVPTTPTSGQDTQNIVPGIYPNPIVNTTTTPGIKVSAVMVENNTDAAGNPVSDHLQFTIENLSGKILQNPEVYYTITDTANGKKEGYYQKLTGFTLAPHASGIVHFDGQSGAGHYPVNMHGIYGTATDQLKFSAEVSVAGYAPVQVNATKAPGGAEVVGQ